MTAPCPTIPREQWTTHRNFPDQVLLLGSHTNFRRISRYLVDAAEAGDDLSGIAGLYLRWIAGMRSHEAYEERKLYPYLERRWALSLATAQAGHEELHACHDAVIEALYVAAKAVQDGGSVDPGATRALVDALRRHDEVLQAHLDLEEELVIPALLELSREEFERYSNASIADLLGDTR